MTFFERWEPAPPKTADEILWEYQEAWQAWRAHSCVEFNGRHSWYLVIDDGSFHVRCEWCRTIFHPVNDITEFTGEIPVNISVDACGRGYHGWSLCDCGWWFVLEGRNDQLV